MTTTALSSPEIVATRIGRRLTSIAIQAVMLLAAVPAMAQSNAARQLEAIDVQSLPGQILEVRLRLSDTPPEPMSFTIDNPARIALDLPDTSIGMDARRRDVNQGPLSTVLTAEANGRTRVVFNMVNMVPYDTRVVGDSIYVTLGRQGEGAAPAAFAAQPAPQSGGGAAATAAGRSINNIDFRRGRNGAGQIVVDLSNPRTTVDVREEGGRIIVDFQGTTLPTDLMRRLDVTDFATPVATVDALRADNNARLIVTTAEAYEQVAYQTDNVFTLELAPGRRAGAHRRIQREPRVLG